MEKIVGVVFRKTGKIGYFKTGLSLKVGEKVIVRTARGEEFGEVVDVLSSCEAISEELSGEIVRKATKNDVKKLERLRRKERKAEGIASTKIKEHELPMKLVEVEYLFDESKVIFYFTAEGRVDFRNLVKDLAKALRKRIELRQIGVRDEARMIGGLGPCGRNLCCASFLFQFEPVSIKMAREQNLPLNPMKISGLCGRLMCCLKYEYHLYAEFRKKAPPIGTEVDTEKGPAVIVEYNVPKESVIVELKDGGFRFEIPLEKLKRAS